jgi:hypothetical protein
MDVRTTQLQQLFNNSEIQGKLYGKTSLIQTLWDVLARLIGYPTNHDVEIRLAFFTNAIIILLELITKQFC